MNLTLTELKEKEIVAFNNDHEPWEEPNEVEIHFGQLSTWDNPFKIFRNGQLIASFKSRKAAFAKLNQLVENLKLERI